ncbi:hypothetical protein B566_EDAN015304 [Ephemera danica]|nr:hypothetical protein B566_EDAN015304 [Ephemera danica]
MMLFLKEMPLEMEAASGAGVTNEMTSDTSAAKRIKLSPSPVTVKEEPEFEFVHLLGVPEKIHTIKVEEPDEDIDIKYEPIGIVEEEPMEIEQSLSQHAEPERSNVQTQPFEEVLLPSPHDNGPSSPPNVTSEPIAASVKKVLLLSSHLQNHSTNNDPVPTPNLVKQIQLTAALHHPQM